MRRRFLVTALGVLGAATFGCRRPTAAKAGASLDAPEVQRVLEISIEGMHCRGCVDVISHALVDHDGVVAAEVELEKGRARVGVGSGAPQVEVLIETIYDLGYEAKLVESN